MMWQLWGQRGIAWRATSTWKVGVLQVLYLNMYKLFDSNWCWESVWFLQMGIFSLFTSVFLMKEKLWVPIKGQGKSWDSWEHMKYFSEIVGIFLESRIEKPLSRKMTASHARSALVEVLLLGELPQHDQVLYSRLSLGDVKNLSLFLCCVPLDCPPDFHTAVQITHCVPQKQLDRHAWTDLKSMCKRGR